MFWDFSLENASIGSPEPHFHCGHLPNLCLYSRKDTQLYPWSKEPSVRADQGTRHSDHHLQSRSLWNTALSIFNTYIPKHSSWFYELGLCPRAGSMCWEELLDFQQKTNILFLLVIGTKLYRFVQWEVFIFPTASVAKPSMRPLHHSCSITVVADVDP